MPARLPADYRSWVPTEASEALEDFSTREDLYAKPVFGDCVWTDEAGRVLEAWAPPARRESFARRLRKAGRRAVCRALPQPCVADGRARSFVLGAGPGGVRWPAEWAWAPEPSLPPLPEDARPALAWPADFRQAYLADVRRLSGEDELVFRGGRRLRLQRKNSAQEGHQLEELLDYLEERYGALGLRTRRERFRWRGLPQSNLIAVLPGTSRGRANRPVVLADHVDTAFAEDVFRRSGGRVSVPGADDDASASAALLAAARILEDAPRRHDVWLVHLTGEEFPADDLGARHWTRRLLKDRRELTAVLLLDMIAYRDPGDPVFQVNAGEGRGALEAAQAALALAGRLDLGGFQPRLRRRFDPASYLYNTDGLIFSHAGYPVVLFNEHLNAGHNLMRPHYHESTDDSSRLDLGLAEAVSRLALETAAYLAGRGTGRP